MALFPDDNYSSSDDSIWQNSSNTNEKPKISASASARPRQSTTDTSSARGLDNGKRHIANNDEDVEIKHEGKEMKLKTGPTTGRKRKLESLVYDLVKVENRMDEKPGFVCLSIEEIGEGGIKRLKEEQFTYIEPPNKEKNGTRNSNGDGCENENEIGHVAVASQSELLLRDVAVPLLRNAGWKINSKLTKFKFKSGDSTFNIGRAEILKCIQRIEPSIKTFGNPTFDATDKDPVMEKLIVEDIMLARNKRLIDLEEAVRSSMICLKNHKTERNVKTKVNVVTKKEKEENQEFHAENDDDHENNKSASGTSNADISNQDHVTPEPITQKSNFQTKSLHDSTIGGGGRKERNEKHKATGSKSDDDRQHSHSSKSNSSNQHDNKAPDRPTKKSSSKAKVVRNAANVGNEGFVKILQLLPKKTFENIAILDADSLHDIQNMVFKYQDVSYSASARKRLLNMKIFDKKDDRYSVVVSIKGRGDLANDARKRLMKYVRRCIAGPNIQTILDDRAGYEAEVRLDVTEDLGLATLARFHQERYLWIDHTTPNLQIHQIFGNSTHKGALLIKLKFLNTWTTLQKVKDKNDIIKRAKERYQKSGDEKDRWIKAHFYISKDANLRQMNLENNDRIAWIRRRNSTWQHIYRGKKRKRAGSLLNNQKNSKQNISSEKLEAQRNNSQTAKKAKDDAKPAPVKKQKREGTSRQNFIEKMKEVKDIEFRNLKIPHKIINQSMWRAHIRLFGENCDARCKCSSKLGILTKDVIKNHVLDEERSRDWTNPFNLSKESQPVVGFAKNFCGKFYVKVEKKFPTDSPHQILQRLLVMWKKHIAQRRFGIKCGNNCPCIDSWEILFLPACKIALQREGSQSSILSNRSKAKSSNGSSGPIEFCVSLKPSKTNMGLFFTDNGGQCIVSSVDPNGFAKKKVDDFQIGTIVVGVSDSNNQRRQVKSWKDLEESYNILKQVDRKLQIWFSKPSEGKSSKTVAECKNDWTQNGGWIDKGVSESGWAGGSGVVRASINGNSNVRVQEEPSRNEHRESFQDRLSQKNPLSHKQQSAGEADSNSQLLIVADNSRKNADKKSSFSAWVSRKQAHPSIVRRNGEESQRPKKKVRINIDKNEEFLIEARSETQSSTKKVERLKEDIMLPQYSIDNVVKCLKQTPRSKDELESLSSALQDQMKVLHDFQEQTDNQTEYDSNAKELVSLKHKNWAVRIFERVGDVIESSHLTNEPIFHRFNPITSQVSLTPEGEQHQVDNFLFCSLHVNKSMVNTTSKVSFSKQANWQKPGIDNELSTLSKQSGQRDGFYGKDVATIELKKGSPDTSSIVLGEVSVSLFSDDTSELNLNRSNSKLHQLRTGKFLETGTLYLKHSTIIASAEKVLQKKTSVAADLKELIRLIRKFKVETGYTLSADISSFDNVSLLHAAISCCDKDIVADLLKMGANKQVESKTLGIPIEHARNLVKDAVKWRDLKGKDIYHEIIQILDR